ncbi:MAG: phosphoribosyl-ATP diphosphatase [Gammaproteobacteria bacterium]|nr:phosphoribosyl-ATP diphosphatase [Gammaproteobacteria bacterium]
MAQSDTMSALQQVLRERLAANPDDSYVASLYAKGLDHILKKVGEESAEVIIAAKGEDELALVKEVADLWFHCMVLLVQKGLSSEDVLAELNQRFGISGHEEKASRSK